jgi:exonuclease III
MASDFDSWTTVTKRRKIGNFALFRAPQRSAHDGGVPAMAHFKSVDAVRGETRQGQRETRATHALCILNAQHFSLDTVIRKIGFVLHDHELDYHVYRVRDYFLVHFTHENHRDCALQALRKVGSDAGWHAVQWRSYRNRNEDDTKTGDSTNKPAKTTRPGGVQPGSSLSFFTWNVCGLKAKIPQMAILNGESAPVDILALQEVYGPNTANETAGLGMKIAGYNVFNAQYDIETQGSHGVLLAIKKKFNSWEYGPPTHTVVAARVDTDGAPLLVLSAYIPVTSVPTRGIRKQTIKDIRRVVGRWTDEYPQGQILLVGDLNTAAKNIHKIIKKCDIERVVTKTDTPTQPEHYTFFTPKSTSIIDHVCVRSWDAHEMSGQVWVDRDYGTTISGHLPIRGDIKCTPLLPQITQAPSLDRKGMDAELLARLKATSYYAPLLSDDREEDIPDQEVSSDFAGARQGVDDDGLVSERIVKTPSDHAHKVAAITEQFTAITRQFLSDSGVLNVKVRKLKGARLHKVLKATIDKRRKLWAQWRKNGSGKAALLEINVAIDKLSRDALKTKWLKYVKSLVDGFRDGDVKKGWAGLKSISGKGTTKSTVGGPVLGTDGKLITKPQDILARWAEHFEGLCADSTGGSRNMNHWDEVFQERVQQYRKETLDLTDFDWHDVCETMRGMKPGKAAGISQLPLELFRLGCPSLQELDEAMRDGRRVQPHTPLHRAAYRVIRLIFEQGSVPASLNSACCVPIFKKGDVHDPNMYRGISLIEILLKILTTLVTRRIYAALQQRQHFCREQGGFRTREECVAQYMALREVLLRRRAANKRSFVFFSDFRKAFDTVGHSPMIAKLEEAGVRGTWINFFYALYQSARISVRTKSGTSPCVNFSNGVRQGCPASPLAFIVFINDLFDTCKAAGLGVSVPGVNDSTFCGLLFADDAVHVCGSSDDLHSTLNRLSTWTKRWGLSYGIKKCGVMIVEGTGEECFGLAPDFRIDGDKVPIVSHYEYLGLHIDKTLSLCETTKQRALPALRAARAAARVVGNTSIPIGLRVKAWKTLVVPTVTYGGEIHGAHARSHKHLQPLERVLVGSMASLVKGSWRVGTTADADGIIPSCRPPMGTSKAVLYSEIMGSDLYSLLAGMRARAVAKYPSLGTWAGVLSQHPAPRGHAFNACWANTNRRFLNTLLRRIQPYAAVAHKPEVFCEWTSIVQSLIDAPSSIPSARAAAAVKEMTQYFQDLETTISEGRYDAHGRRVPSATDTYGSKGYAKTVADLHMASMVAPALAYGFHWLLRLRTGAFILQEKAEKTPWGTKLSPKGRCPCCLTKPNVADSVAHFLFRCDAFKEARREIELRKSSVKLIRAASPGIKASDAVLSDENLVVLLCGGTVALTTAGAGNLSLRVEVDVRGDVREVVNKIPSIPKGKRQQSLVRIGFLLLAAFLNATMARRNKFLWGPSKSTPTKPG